MATNDKYSKRLEIRIDNKRLAMLQRKARETKKSIAELIRDAIDKQYRWATISRKLHAMEKLKNISLPLANWQDIKKEIEVDDILEKKSL